MPAFRSAGLAGKRRFIRRAEFDDDEGIIAAVLQLDAARVGGVVKRRQLFESRKRRKSQPSSTLVDELLVDGATLAAWYGSARAMSPAERTACWFAFGFATR
jgi:hypothetical protein